MSKRLILIEKERVPRKVRLTSRNVLDHKARTSMENDQICILILQRMVGKRDQLKEHKF